MIGWLAVPALVVVLALIGMAVSTEPKEDFEQRTAEQGDGADGDRSGRSGGTDRSSDTAGDGERSDGERSDPAGGRSGDGDGRGRQPITIRNENGEIVIELDDDGNPVRVVPAEAADPIDPDRVITPDPGGELSGLRVTDDGELQPVDRRELRSDDFLVGPGPDGGVDITRPDGSRIQLTPTESGVDGVDIDVDGNSRPATNDAGEIVIQPAGELGSGGAVEEGAEPIVIDAAAGPVRIELNEDGDLVAGRAGDGGGVVIDRDELRAIRIDEDGNLELVPLDEVGPDDTILVPADDGFDLVRPDGSRVEFRPDGEHDGMTATEVSPDGQETELTPNPDGSVTLADGTTVGPIDIAEDGGPIEQLLDQTSDLPWPWVFGAIVVLALLSVATAVYLYRNQPADALDYSRFAARGVPEAQFESFLAVLAADDDPTRAIRLAFYAAERGLAGLPNRRIDETPFEWHDRVAKLRPELAEPLGPICDLFARARFAPGLATAADRDRMISALRALQAAADRAGTGATMAGA